MTTMPLEKPPVRIAELADQCVQCGLCLPVCPTYGLDGNEAESPRGRIAIAAALARGDAEPTAALRQHLDHCLGCLNCQRVCPAQVQYDELLLQTRALLGPPPGRPHGLLALLKHPALLRRLRAAARLLPGPGWARSWLGPAWRSALALLPAAGPAAPARGDRSSTQLALFPGCVASVEDAQAQQAAVTLLRAAGFRIAVLPAFCCGAMDAHGGKPLQAEHAAMRVREAWRACGAQRLVTVTPGCLGTLRARLPSVQVSDAYALLAEHAGHLRFRPLRQRVALHLPCTQINVARSEAALLALLRRVPELEVLTIARARHCCGAAGSHMLEFPERAARLRQAVLQQIEPLAAERLLSSNIGCRLHLAAGLAEQGSTLATAHPLVLLAGQLDPT